MNFIELAKSRFSCRDYKPQKIEKHKLIALMEAAQIAPSANNQQPWFFYVVQDDEILLQKLKSSYHRQWFETAPAAIVCCADKNAAWVRKYDGKNHSDVDVSIAIDHLTLMSTDLGLATCWICNFDKHIVAQTLGLASNIEPVAILSLGYPNTQPDKNRFAIKRKNLEQIAKFL